MDKVPRISGREEKSWENFTTSPDGSMIAFLGNDGYIILLDSQTKRLIAEFKMNGSVRSVAFTSRLSSIGVGLYKSSMDWDLVASGSDGDVYT